MSQKITIDQEIKNIKCELDAVEDTSPYYYGADLKEIHSYVFVNHAYFERSVEALILFKIREAGKFELKDWRVLVEMLKPLLAKCSFHAKLELVKNTYLPTNEGQKLAEYLGKVNTIRNEWAHSDGRLLHSRYGYNAPKGKQEIRDLFRALKRVKDALDDYFRDKV